MNIGRLTRTGDPSANTRLKMVKQGLEASVASWREMNGTIGKRSQSTSENERNRQPAHRFIAHETGVGARLLTGVRSAFGDGQVRAWAPRAALIILLAFPTVRARRVVFTLAGQPAVVIYTHGGVQVTFAPGQRRDKSSASVGLASGTLRLRPSPRVEALTGLPGGSR